jgi:hypothetical protein
MKTLTQFKLPGFFSTGLVVHIEHNQRFCNAPGLTGLELIAMIQSLRGKKSPIGLVLSQFMLSHYHPQAGHDARLVAEFNDDCMSELLIHGGTLPHESIKD